MNIAWWKWLGVLLIVYTLVIGMTIRLGPGVESMSTSQISGGEDFITVVRCYNSQFKEGGHPRAWIKLDSVYSLRANGVEVLSDREIRLSFSPPVRLPDGRDKARLSLIVDHDQSGTMLMPRTLFFRNGISDDYSGDDSSWTEYGIADLTVSRGLSFPYRPILIETIRNTFFHVAFWMAMFAILLGSAFYAVRYLRTKDLLDDMRSQSLAEVGLLYGLIGLLTGMVWANYTWGEPWPPDVKLNMTAVALMIYIAYFVLRTSVNEWNKQARLAAVYNIFAFVSLFPLLFVIPRMAASLHPGNGGNPAFGEQDLDNTLRMIFYPAIIGWILIGLWMAQLHFRILKIRKL